MEYLQCRGRTLSNKALINRRDIKGMLRVLDEGEPLWYAPDHDYGPRRSVFVPFLRLKKLVPLLAPRCLPRVKYENLPSIFLSSSGWPLQVNDPRTTRKLPNREPSGRCHYL